MRVSSLLLSVCSLAVLVLVSGCATGGFDSYRVSWPYTDPQEMEEGSIVHLPTGRTLERAELYDYLGEHRVVYVGESHDNVDDHQLQFDVVKALNERYPGKVAIGLEMMRFDSQEDADKWVAGELTEKEFTKVWIKNWGNTFDYYADILRYARDNKIKIVAMNRPRPKMSMHKAAMTKPPEEKSGEAEAKPAETSTAAEAKPAETAMEEPEAADETPEMPEPPPEPEIDYDDPYYREYIGAFMAGHDAGPDIMEMFLKGQMLWDETMAEKGAQFLSQPENADTRLVVLAGGNHVRYGFGIPRRLFRRLPVSYAIISTRVIEYPQDKLDRLMDVDLPELPLPEADIMVGVGYNDLEGDSVKLGVGISDAEEGGVLVKSVMPGSSAEKAGFQPDDVITDIDGVEVVEMFDLTYELGHKEVGQEGKVTVKRGDETVTLDVTYDVLKHGEMDK